VRIVRAEIDVTIRPLQTASVNDEMTHDPEGVAWMMDYSTLTGREMEPF
jgi:hypothetical protein